MHLGIAEILKKISDEKDTDKRKQLLANNSKNKGLATVLKYAFCPSIKFNLPEGEPPYKPCQFGDQQSMLYINLRKMYLFIGEGNPNVSKNKREMLFVNLLESLDPEDAKLLLAVKDKKMPYKGITKKLVTEIFPGLIEDNG